jgi:hypothetical protein
MRVSVMGFSHVRDETPSLGLRAVDLESFPQTFAGRVKYYSGLDPAVRRAEFGLDLPRGSAAKIFGRVKLDICRRSIYRAAFPLSTGTEIEEIKKNGGHAAGVGRLGSLSQDAYHLDLDGRSAPSGKKYISRKKYSKIADPDGEIFPIGNVHAALWDRPERHAP